MRRIALGELCSLVKGTSPISRTQPGPYPLVTTGEDRKTADAFQFEREAVCIPLISSTGHGHASLKRVHYQAGKFALANLLAAAVVKDRALLSTKFLARYLMFTKDRLIVPLMTGAANMSISLDRLATVPIEFPSITEQERITGFLDEAEKLLDLRGQADRRTADLIPAIFYEMFGDAINNSKRWPLATIKEISDLVTGNTPPRSSPELYGDFIEWVKTDNIDPIRGVVHQAAEHLSEDGAKRGRLIPAGSVVVTCIAGSLNRIGDAAVVDREVAINQQINALLPRKGVEPLFLWQLTRSLSKAIQARATGVMTRIVNKAALESVPAIYPPSKLQADFASNVLKVRRLQDLQTASGDGINALFQSVWHHAFEGGL